MREIKRRVLSVGLIAACLLAGNTRASEEAGAPHPAALAQLEWLLGEWTGLTDDAVILVSANWCDGGAFIEREVIVRREGQDDVGGTQRIGWDPLTGKIKCWSFDSLGGFGEGYWRQDGKNWVVESQEVLPDGRQSTTQTVFTPQDADRFGWEVASAKIEGLSLPKQKIEFVRAAKE